MAFPVIPAVMLTAGESFSRAELTGDVEHAVLRLRELGSQMKDNSHHFSAQDLNNIDELVYYLKELDSKRIKAHECLEAETITNSVVRRKLEYFPERIAKEVRERVQSARDLNAEQINTLETKAAEITEQMGQTLRKQELLDMHNDLLESEQKKLAEVHSVLVEKLNVRMAERSKIQIEFNETSREFKDEVQKVNSVKSETREVEEDMEKVMKSFTGKMYTLNKTLEGVKGQQKEKIEEIRDVEKKLVELKHEVVEEEITVEDKLATLNQSEAGIKSLLNSETSMKAQLAQGDEEIEQLKEKRVIVEREAKKVREDYAVKNKEVAEKRGHLHQQIAILEVENGKLILLCRGLKRELKGVSDDATMQDEVLRDIKEKVTETKKTLLKHAEEGAQLAKEYENLVKKMNELKISHQETMSVLSDEIIEAQKRLQQDTKTKEVVQSGFDELTKNVEDKTVDHKATIANMQKRLTDGKRLSADLSERMTSLEAATQQCCGEIEACNGQLKDAHAKLIKRRKSLIAAVNLLEENVTDLRGEIADRDETLSKIKPQYMALDKDHYKLTDTYENEKRELIALKSKKSETQDRIKEVQRALEKMHIPRQKLKMDTLRCRAYTRQKVFQRTTDVDNLEKQVTDASQRLRAIQKENKRIIQNSQILSQEIRRMRSVLSCSKEMEEQLDIALKLYKYKLSEQQRNNGELEKTSSARDRLVLKDITELREASAHRHHVVSTLHEQFQEELKGFADYLRVTASGHPSEGHTF